MKNIFDNVDVVALKTENTRFYALFATITIISVAVCALSVIFWEKTGRFVAQTLATLFTIVPGCVGVYGFTVVARNKRVISFVIRMQTAVLSEFYGVVTATDKKITTMNGLRFYAFSVTDGEKERRFYIPFSKDLPEKGKKVFLKSNGKYVAFIEIEETENE